MVGAGRLCCQVSRRPSSTPAEHPGGDSHTEHLFADPLDPSAEWTSTPNLGGLLEVGADTGEYLDYLRELVTQAQIALQTVSSLAFAHALAHMEAVLGPTGQ